MASDKIRPRLLCTDCPNGVAPAGELGNRQFRCNFLKESVTPPSHCLFYGGPRWPIDIVVITATEVERRTVYNELESGGNVVWEPISPRSDGHWTVCKYGLESHAGEFVRIALGRTRIMGLTAAASLTALAIQIFRPRLVVMLGVAAGNRKRSFIGDIIVAQEIWDYGAGKWDETKKNRLKFLPRAERQSLQEHIRSTCEILVAMGKVQSSIEDERKTKIGGRRKYRKPAIRLGPMVSGAAVVNSEKIWDNILLQNDKILALDMEAFGVAFSTELSRTSEYQPAWLVAKAVSDYGIRKRDGAQKYAALASALFFVNYLNECVLSPDRKVLSTMNSNVPDSE